MKHLQEIQSICDGIEYTRTIPYEATALAKENNCIVIVGGSDDLMYCYGAPCFMTNHCEHSYGWDGDTLEGIPDKELESEAAQLGLKIWWCGEIVDAGLSIEDYDVDESGAFYYSVKEGIEALDFKVMEDDEVYCTGKVIQLPSDFEPSN